MSNAFRQIIVPRGLQASRKIIVPRGTDVHFRLPSLSKSSDLAWGHIWKISKPIWLIVWCVVNRWRHDMSIFLQIAISDFFAQNTAAKYRHDGFYTFYVWHYIRSNEKRFKPNLTCWVGGWESVGSRYGRTRVTSFNFQFPISDFPSESFRKR